MDDTFDDVFDTITDSLDTATDYTDDYTSSFTDRINTWLKNINQLDDYTSLDDLISDGLTTSDTTNSIVNTYKNLFEPED